MWKTCWSLIPHYYLPDRLILKLQPICHVSQYILTLREDIVKLLSKFSSILGDITTLINVL